MDRDDREELSKCLYWSILRITGPPELELPEPRFEITRSVIEKSLALLDPEDFLCQALLYYQNYLQHKELHIPESGTYQASVVELLNEARSESQDPTQTARKRHLDDGYDGDEGSLQGKKRVRIFQESYERGIKHGYSAIS
ncbi:hypothetical protein FGLOB1_1929 [Fusarium globosum]|uniref:Uncharacterized protein n=1 Tax=Fusarium globosum TaxID=78864 RepID=A0A8H5YV80_9HYPO|nr:hypothetical protein FGLOB1_1929 [Fusarium globosum]